MSVHSRRASRQDRPKALFIAANALWKAGVRHGAAFTSQVHSVVIQAWPPEMGMRKQMADRNVGDWFGPWSFSNRIDPGLQHARLLSQSLILNLWRRAKELLCFVLQSSWLTGLSRSSRTWTRRPELWNTFSAKFQTRSTTEYASYRLSSECERHGRNARARTHTGAHAAHCTLKWMQRGPFPAWP